MADYTLTYAESAQGFPSFYSYFPEWMIGMNNYFYSFKGGNLYRHNTNSTRNNYYGVQGNSIVTGIFNDAPVTNKLFKTLMLESNDTWSATVTTDMQSGEIDGAWFEKKESDWFAFIRYIGAVAPSVTAPTSQYPLRSVNGIGECTTAIETPVASGIYVVSFASSIGSIISNGDFLYKVDAPFAANLPVLLGQITAHNDTSVTVDTNVVGGSAPSNLDFIMYIKNNIAESHGVLGHFMEFTITNTNTAAIELFAIVSDSMKSYP